MESSDESNYESSVNAKKKIGKKNAKQEKKITKQEKKTSKQDKKTPKNLIKDQKKSFVRSEFVSVVKYDPSKLKGTFKTHFNEAKKHPALGALMMNLNSDKAMIASNGSHLNGFARDIFDDIGKISRKSKEDSRLKNFMGHPCPSGLCKEYFRGPPRTVQDCYEVALHTYPPMVHECGTIDRAVISCLNRPMFPFLKCSKHSDCCCLHLNKGDIVRVCGDITTHLVSGKVWYSRLTSCIG
jgi:hypothetical protein